MIYKMSKLFKFPIVISLSLILVGCVTIPTDFLKLSEDSLKYRELQMRRFDTQDEELIMAACAGVLQDLGFTLDDSETELGLVVGSKDRDATHAGQVAWATFTTLLAAVGGTSSDAFNYIDKQQKIQASVVSNPSLDGAKIVVRVTFQRIVWNNIGNISRMETLNESHLYQGFFERLSKSVFLEAHKI